MDAYSGVQDLDVILNLGPQNLTCSNQSASPDLVNTSGNSSGLFSETTATLSGESYFFVANLTFLLRFGEASGYFSWFGG